MGVNTNTYLYPGVELEDLVEALRNLTDADQVTLTNGWGDKRGVLSMGRGDTFVQGQDWYDLSITRARGWDDGETGHSGAIFVNDSAERGIPKGGYYVHGGNAGAFWCQLGEELVDLFGGALDINDCDASDVDYSKGRTLLARVHDDSPQYETCRAKLAALTNVCGDLRRWDNHPGIYDRRGRYTG